MAKKVNINLPLPNIEIRLDGDWVKVENLIDNLESSIRGGYDNAIELISKKILSIVKSAITTGQPPPNSGVQWAPLSPNTIKQHGAHDIYYLTGLYYRSIGLYKYKNRTLVGLPLNIKRPNTKNLTLNKLAILLEYGDKAGRIPPRPLWNSSLKSYGGRDKIKKVIMHEIRHKIMEKTGLTQSQIRASW